MPVPYLSNDVTALEKVRDRDIKEVLQLWPCHIGRCDREDVRLGLSSS